MSNWYADMAAAMQKRQVAVNGRERWQAKVEEAEAEIAALANGAVEPAPVPAPEEGPSFSGLAPDYSETAE